MAGFTLAHLSDPHLATDPSHGAWSRLTLKQIQALSSWRRRRVHLHRMAAVEMLTNDVGQAEPCHLAVTGDLVNIASPVEFVTARDWLATLGPADRVSVVPGNHDLLRANAAGTGIDSWSSWMASDGNAARGPAFPYLQRRRDIALIGLNSSLPTPLFVSGGVVGRAQIARAGALLREAGRAGLFRIMLIHHPPVAGPGGWRKALWDRGALRAMLAREGAELVLHGHHHRTSFQEIRGPDAPIAVFGVPSASAWPPAGGRHAPAGWHLHRIVDEGSRWRLASEARILDPAAGRFVTAGRWDRTIPRAVSR